MNNFIRLNKRYMTGDYYHENASIEKGKGQKITKE